MIKKLFQNYRFITVLWFALALATIIQNVFIKGEYNNYLIFRGVFWHTIQQLPLYVSYPHEYFDMNHYGIFFSGISVGKVTGVIQESLYKSAAVKPYVSITIPSYLYVVTKEK